MRPDCGEYVLMPGAIPARFMMPRALKGRFSISSFSTGADTDMRCTSTCFTRSAVTVCASSSAAPFSSANSSRARCPITSCTVSVRGR